MSVYLKIWKSPNSQDNLRPTMSNVCRTGRLWYFWFLWKTRLSKIVFDGKTFGEKRYLTNTTSFYSNNLKCWVFLVARSNSTKSYLFLLNHSVSHSVRFLVHCTLPDLTLCATGGFSILFRIGYAWHWACWHGFEILSLQTWGKREGSMWSLIIYYKLHHFESSCLSSLFSCE